MNINNYNNGMSKVSIIGSIKGENSLVLLLSMWVQYRFLVPVTNSMSGNNWSSSNDLWMSCMSWSDDNSVETVMVIGSVFYGTDGTIWFVQGVFTTYNITNTGFDLLFVVSCMRISYSVFVFVVRWSLRNNWKMLILLLR